MTRINVFDEAKPVIRGNDGDILEQSSLGWVEKHFSLVKSIVVDEGKNGYWIICYLDDGRIFSSGSHSPRYAWDWVTQDVSHAPQLKLWEGIQLNWLGSRMVIGEPPKPSGVSKAVHKVRLASAIHTIDTILKDPIGISMTGVQELHVARTSLSIVSAGL